MEIHAATGATFRDDVMLPGVEYPAKADLNHGNLEEAEGFAPFGLFSSAK